MIFAVETEERTLMSFVDEAAAVSYCEGLDVEAAVWLFWNDRGEPLEPHFSIPNKRGFFSVHNGVYSLVDSNVDHHAVLDEALDEILTFENDPPFDSAEGVRNYLRVSQSK